MIKIIGCSLVILGTILYIIGYIGVRRSTKRERRVIEDALHNAGYV